jgi:hypothetical protein
VPLYIYSSAAKLLADIIHNVAKGGWTEIDGYWFCLVKTGYNLHHSMFGLQPSSLLKADDPIDRS